MQRQPVPGPRCQGRWPRADAASRLELRKTIGGRRQPARETAQIAIDQRGAALLGAAPPPHPKPTGWKLQLHCLPGTLQIDRPRVAKFLVAIEKWGWSTSAWWWQRRSMARASGRSLGWTWVPVKTAPSGWPSLRSLSARGLSGVELVVSDAHQGLRGAIAAVFGGASWQRCRTHFMTNLLTRVPRRAQPWVATMVRTIYQQPSPDEVHAQLDRVTDQLQNRFPQVASLLDEAGPDVLAFSSFPLAHWNWTRPERPGSGPTTHRSVSTRRSGDAPMWWASSLTGRPCAASLAPSWLSSTTNGPLAVDTSHLSC